MKQGKGISASIGAILSVLATVGCCFPIGFTAALGAGAASAFFAKLRPFLLGLSIVLISLGFWQQHRSKQCAVRGRWISKIMLWAAVIVVVAMILFPQQVAGLVGGELWRSPK